VTESDGTVGRGGAERKIENRVREKKGKIKKKAEEVERKFIRKE
jgi:hypothetical protein